MSAAGILLRVADLARSRAFYLDVFGAAFHADREETEHTTEGPALVLPWKAGGCLIVLEAPGAGAPFTGMPIVAAAQPQDVRDPDGNTWRVFAPGELVERYETGLGAPILPLSYAIRRGALDAEWVRAWGHGGRDPVTAAWNVSVGYLDELLAALGRDETQAACDLRNDLAGELEPIFIQERIRATFRAPTLAEAERAAGWNRPQAGR